MDYIELNRICENVVERIFKKLPSLKFKIKDTTEQTDSGVLHTIKIEVIPKGE